MYDPTSERGLRINHHRCMLIKINDIYCITLLYMTHTNKNIPSVISLDREHY